MKEEFLNNVYNILVWDGGASESMRMGFILNHLGDNPCQEWRFCGYLGFGGKYYSERNRVSCYREDETPDIKDIVELINKKLAALNK